MSGKAPTSAGACQKQAHQNLIALWARTAEAQNAPLRQFASAKAGVAAVVQGAMDSHRSAASDSASASQSRMDAATQSAAMNINVGTASGGGISLGAGARVFVAINNINVGPIFDISDETMPAAASAPAQSARLVHIIDDANDAEPARAEAASANAVQGPAKLMPAPSVRARERAIRNDVVAKATRSLDGGVADEADKPAKKAKSAARSDLVAPPGRQPATAALRVKQYDNVQCFKVAGDHLVCTACNEQVDYKRKSVIDDHLKSNKHMVCYTALACLQPSRRACVSVFHTPFACTSPLRLPADKS